MVLAPALCMQVMQHNMTVLLGWPQMLACMQYWLSYLQLVLDNLHGIIPLLFNSRQAGLSTYTAASVRLSVPSIFVVLPLLMLVQTESSRFASEKAQPVLCYGACVSATQ